MENKTVTDLFNAPSMSESLKHRGLAPHPAISSSFHAVLIFPSAVKCCHHCHGCSIKKRCEPFFSEVYVGGDHTDVLFKGWEMLIHMSRGDKPFITICRLAWAQLYTRGHSVTWEQQENAVVYFCVVVKTAFLLWTLVEHICICLALCGSFKIGTFWDYM